MEVKDFTTICRTCMSVSTRLYNIFDEKCWNKTKLVDPLMELTCTQITSDDRLPSSICDSCLERLKDYVKFKTKCFEFRQMLQDRLIRAESSETIESDSYVDECGPPEPNDETRPYAYKHCDKWFKRKSHLRMHAAMHSRSAESSYECTTCSRRSLRNTTSSARERSHDLTTFSM